MRKTIFASVLLAAPLAMGGAYAQESDTSQDPATQETGQQDSMQQDPTMQDASEQDSMQQDPTMQDASEQDSMQQDPTMQDASEQDSMQQDPTMQDASEQDSMQQDPTMQDASQQGSMQQDQQQAGGGEPELERAQFTRDVQDKEPVDEISDSFQASNDPLYFFTEVKNASGETITHRWKHDGEVKAEVPLEVGSDSWRTWSSKELMPEWEGEWTVEVVDSQGNVIDEQSVQVETSQQQNVSYSPDQQQSGSSQQGQESSQQSGQEGQVERASMETGEETGQGTNEEDSQRLQEDDVSTDVSYEDEQGTEAMESEEPLFNDTAEETDATEDTSAAEDDWR